MVQLISVLCMNELFEDTTNTGTYRSLGVPKHHVFFFKIINLIEDKLSTRLRDLSTIELFPHELLLI